jgi:hypothetical protein
MGWSERRPSEGGRLAAGYRGDGAVDTYIGTDQVISVSRDDEGRYHFYDGDGDGNGRMVGYDYRTCT